MPNPTRNAHPAPEATVSAKHADLHASLMKSGTLVINEGISNASLYSVYLPLVAMVEERQKLATAAPIEIIINSPGGNAFMGLSIAKFIANSTVPITTRVVGWAASAAGIIFLGGHHRIVSPGSRVMLHDSTWGYEAYGANSTQRLAQAHRELDDESVDFIAERTGLDRTYVKEECSKDHWYISSSNALAHGMATRIA